MKNQKLPFFCTNLLNDSKDFYKQFKTVCNENYSELDCLYYTFGFEVFGVILLGFCKWLLASLKEKKIKNVMFFSRDGKIIKKAFELFPESDEFNTEYVYLSRRSLRVPLIWKSNESRKDIICPTKYISIKDLLDSIGLDYKEYSEYVDSNALTFETVIKDSEIESNSKVVSLLDDVWNDVIINSKNEYENLQLYINKFEMQGKIAVVDIGWRGSMQLYLDKFLRLNGYETELIGHYITLSSSLYRGIDIHGYLGNVDGSSKGCNRLRGYIGLIELLFMCGDGSVIKYQVNKDGIPCPILAECEYVIDGKRTNELISIESIQHGALDFVRKSIEKGISALNFSADAAFTNLNRFANHPTQVALNMFGEFRFYNNGTVSYLAGKKNKDYSILNVKRIKLDLYESRWRVGFLRQLIKIPFLPYYLLFKLLMKIAM